jgi:general secretion pathway protein D
VNQDLRLLIGAYAQKHRVEYLQAGRILAMNNQYALMEAITITPTFTARIEGETYGGNPLVVYEEGEPIETGAIIGVTPRINGDNSVTLYATPEFGQTNGQVSSPDGSLSIPIQVVRYIETLCRVRDGQTLVIGGGTTDTYDETEVRVPGLSDIPIIGSLFRGHSKVRIRNELLWLITPRVVHDYEEAPEL